MILCKGYATGYTDGGEWLTIPGSRNNATAAIKATAPEAESYAEWWLPSFAEYDAREGRTPITALVEWMGGYYYRIDEVVGCIIRGDVES